jgi:hypothetical protein
MKKNWNNFTLSHLKKIISILQMDLNLLFKGWYRDAMQSLYRCKMKKINFPFRPLKLAGFVEN